MFSFGSNEFAYSYDLIILNKYVNKYNFARCRTSFLVHGCLPKKKLFPSDENTDLYSYSHPMRRYPEWLFIELSCCDFTFIALLAISVTPFIPKSSGIYRNSCQPDLGRPEWRDPKQASRSYSLELHAVRSEHRIIPSLHRIHPERKLLNDNRDLQGWLTTALLSHSLAPFANRLFYYT